MNEQSIDEEKDQSPGEASKDGNMVSESQETPVGEMTREQLMEKVQALQKESDKNYDLYLRSQAEMENMKKRNKKDKEDWLKFANESLMKEILPVVDNLEKALSHSNNENGIDALKEGIQLTLKGLKDSLFRSGLEEVKALGELFDPCFHEAVSEISDPKAKPGTVVTELQKGYVLNRRLIRPAMVVVNKKQASKKADQDMSSQGACDTN